MIAIVACLAAAVQLPAAIADYYRDYNFVNAFSTLNERRLVTQVDRQPASTRVARVADAMERLERAVGEIDPGIEYPRPARRGIRGTRPRPASPELVFRADLVRVTAFDVDQAAGEAWVYLETLRLDGPANQTLVAKFDDLTSGGRTPAIDDLVTATGASMVVTYEVHRWLRSDGAWLRDRATRHFVGSRRR